MTLSEQARKRVNDELNAIDIDICDLKERLRGLEARRAKLVTQLVIELPRKRWHRGKGHAA